MGVLSIDDWLEAHRGPIIVSEEVSHHVCAEHRLELREMAVDEAQ